MFIAILSINTFRLSAITLPIFPFISFKWNFSLKIISQIQFADFYLSIGIIFNSIQTMMIAIISDEKKNLFQFDTWFTYVILETMCTVSRWNWKRNVQTICRFMWPTKIHVFFGFVCLSNGVKLVSISMQYTHVKNHSLNDEYECVQLFIHCRILWSQSVRMCMCVWSKKTFLSFQTNYQIAIVFFFALIDLQHISSNTIWFWRIFPHSLDDIKSKISRMWFGKNYHHHFRREARAFLNSITIIFISIRLNTEMS